MNTLPHAMLLRCEGDTRKRIVMGPAKAKKGLYCKASKRFP
jgi:hypothetical protein